jgi:glutamyl-tRNA(Gln) amidotransferase subunit D
MVDVKTSSGDKIQIVLKDKTLEGTIMPNETDKLVIKLKNGYNIGIIKKNIKSIKILERHKVIKKEKEKSTNKVVAKNKKLPTISLLHTGGTIASKVDYRTGGVVARFEPEEILEMFPELRKICNIDSKLIGNMWSEDVRFANFINIAKEVIKEYKKGTKGIIITHGTDFLTYTGTALAFMLQNIDIPVILVGAQRSSDRGSSDAASNLVCAAEFIVQTEFQGVAICMHETQDDISCLILNPAKARKMHSSRRDAFRPINCSPIARINYETRDIKFFEKLNHTKEKFNPLLKMEEKVGLIKAHPNMIPSQFSCFKGFKGLIIEGSGLGHAPISSQNKESKENEKVFAEIKKLIKSGTTILMTTQTIYGATQMNVYSKGRDLVKAGIIQSKCLPETALIKLAWLLGNYEKEMKKDSTNLIGKDFVGEMFYRIEDNTYLQ